MMRKGDVNIKNFENCLDNPLFSLGNIALLVLDNKRGLPIIDYSSAILKILETTSDIKGKSFLNFVKNKEKFLKRFSYIRKVKARELWSFSELILSTAKNDEIKVDLKLYPVEKDGKIKFFLGYILNISDLYFEKNIFKTLSKVAPVGILILKEKKLIFANEEAINIFGYEKRDIENTTNLIQFIHPEERDKIKFFEEKLKTNKRITIEDQIRIITKNGKIKWINFRATPLAHNGKSYYLLLVEDITDFIKLETLKNLLFSINKSLLSSNSEEELLENIYLSVREVSLIYAFSLLATKNGDIANLYSFNINIDKVLKLENIPEKQVVGKQELFYIKKIDSAKFNAKWKEYLKSKRINSCLYMPINIDSNRYLLCFYFEDINPLTRDDLEVFKEIKDDIYFSFEHLKQEKQLIINSYYDDKTGVGNRNFFLEYLNSIKDKVSKFLVILIDIYHFKHINEKYGIEFGDKVLRYVAKTLDKEIIEADVFRTGFDEFALVIKEEKDINLILKNIKSVLSNIVIDNITLNLDYNIAIIRYPDDEKNISQLILKLERTLELSKEKGKNNIEFFSKQAYEKLKRHILIEEELEKVIRKGELTPYFQPIVNINTNKIVGAEALIRWKRPDGTFVSPEEFIPVAEETGLVKHIDICMLLKAKQFIEKIKDMGIKISVNITPSNIDEILRFFNGETTPICNVETDNDFSKVIRNISLELTERKGIEVYESKEKIDKLRELGFSISLDDFGKGYSSLSYLMSLNFDYLKIDMDFIHLIDKDDKAYKLVKSIINIAKIFEVKTIAEGVETENQREILKKLGCDYYQGYLFSPPLPMEEFLKLLKENRGQGF